MMKHNRIYYPIPLESEEEYEKFEKNCIMEFNSTYKVESSPETQVEYNKLKKESLKDNTAVEKTNLFDFYNSSIKKEEKTELEQFIIDCINYKIIVKDTKVNREWFKDCYKGKFPVYLEDLTMQHVKQFKAMIRSHKKDEAYEEKLRMQKYKKGYSDKDVYNFCYEFVEIMPKILKDFKKKKLAYWELDENLHRITDANAHEKEDLYISRVDQVLDRMIFLLNEMNEDKCSMKNIYEKEYRKMEDNKRREHGYSGIYKVFTDTEGPDSDGCYRLKYHPEYSKEEKELKTKYFDYERKIHEYRMKCTDEFFDLLKEHFWDLWY